MLTMIVHSLALGSVVTSMGLVEEGRTHHVVVIGSPNVNPGYRLVDNHYVAGRVKAFGGTLTAQRGAGGTRSEATTRWYDVRSLTVEGKGWSSTKAFFDRLPAKAEGVVRPPVWDLSHDSAGLCVRFTTDATSLQARWTVTSKQLAMPHMPATGVSGLDLYVKTERGPWRWVAVGQPQDASTSTMTLVSGLPEGKRKFLTLPDCRLAVSEAHQ